ncbi:unnamed protein product, partial [Rodentolepis nana]|uniref:HTH La-type RNA-binding domain-containing protein n=1 Tax=Rodentolepis nana TaxID=102285 RepID=A0A0R3TQX3_RODNA
ASSTPRVSGPASPISQNGDNKTCISNNNSGSGVTIRNVSNGDSQTVGGVEGADQTQSDFNRSNHSHHEHWNRSSLIMLAVAQASPRTHNTPSASNGTATTPSQPHPVANGGSRFSFNESTGNAAVPSSPKAFPGRRLTSNDEGATSMESQLPKVDEIPLVNSDTSHEEENGDKAAAHAVATNGGLEEITNSLHDSAISTTNGHAGEDIQALSNASAATAAAAAEVVAQKAVTDEVEVIRDGHFFRRLTDKIEQELRLRVEEIEKDLNENELSDEGELLIRCFIYPVSGHLRTTVGKVNLLLSQKFVQFRGLCADCIAASEKTASGEEVEFVTLPSDLEGFWAMVMLQVDDLQSMIASCNRLRQNGWKLDYDAATNGNGINHSTPVSAKRRHPKPVNSTPSKEDKAAALARIEARERIRAVRLQYMRARKEELAANGSKGSNGRTGESGDDSSFMIL